MTPKKDTFVNKSIQIFYPFLNSVYFFPQNAFLHHFRLALAFSNLVISCQSTGVCSYPENNDKSKIDNSCITYYHQKTITRLHQLFT